MLFPPQSDVRTAAHITAVKSAQRIFELDLARVKKPASVDALITSLEYTPEYL
jgi:hypothetical protein